MPDIPWLDFITIDNISAVASVKRLFSSPSAPAGRIIEPAGAAHPRLDGAGISFIPDFPIFHLYKRADPGNGVHWNSADDAARAFRFSELKTRSALRMRDLLMLGRDLGRYGLGPARSLADFAEFSGIDYPAPRLRRIQRP